MINHFNRDYDGGVPNIPLGVGDRYYAQDLCLDFWFLLSQAGQGLKQVYNGFPVLLKESNVVKGSDFTHLTIPIAAGICEYEVDLPLAYAAIPPTVTQDDSIIRVESTLQADLDLAALTIPTTLDGSTNYLKLQYAETDGNSRTRAKKAGAYAYERVPSFSISCDTVAPTNKDIVLAEVIGDGATYFTINRYLRTKRKDATFDFVVTTQAEFNFLLQRVAANQYEFIDNLTSVYVKPLSGGYQMTGGTSILSGGDTWGDIETNNVTKIVFEEGAFIDFAQVKGRLHVNTDGCYLLGVDVRGDKGGAGASIGSFYLDADYCTFENCKSSARLSNAIIKVFEVNNLKDRDSSRFIECTVTDIDSSLNFYGFYSCYNCCGCYVYDVESTGDKCIGFAFGYSLTNCIVKTLAVSGGTDTAIGFYDCYQVSGCKAVDIDSDSGTSTGFANCLDITSCYAFDINSSGDDAYGFSACEQISGCRAFVIDHSGIVAGKNAYGFHTCDQISACTAEDIDSDGGYAVGYWTCVNLSSCYAYDIDSSATSAFGFYSCDQISGCKAEKIDHSGVVAGKNAYGFHFCDQISACKATDIDTNGGGGVANGFAGCSYGAALWTDEAVNAGNDWIDSTDAQITNKVSTPDVWT